MKKVTRRKVVAWFAPLRRALVEIKATGEVETINDQPVMTIARKDDYVRIDFCIASYVRCLKSIFPGAEYSDFTKVQHKLTAGKQITTEEIEVIQNRLNALVPLLMKTPMAVARSAMVDEQISAEFDLRKDSCG